MISSKQLKRVRWWIKVLGVSSVDVNKAIINGKEDKFSYDDWIGIDIDETMKEMFGDKLKEPEVVARILARSIED